MENFRDIYTKRKKEYICEYMYFFGANTPLSSRFYVTIMLQFYDNFMTIMLQLSDNPVTFMLQEPAPRAELLLQLCYNLITTVLHLHYNCVTILLLGHRKRPKPPRFYHRFPSKVNRQIAQILSKFFYPRIYKLFTIHKKFTFTPQKLFFVQPAQNFSNRILIFCTPCTKIF